MPMQLKTLAAAAILCAATLTTEAADRTVSGDLGFNTDVVRIDFTLAAATSVLFWTDSWSAGLNFDPTLALFDGTSLALLALGDDTADPAALLPNQGGYDSQIRLPSLAAGRYFLTLSASGNDALGPRYTDGYSLSGTTPVAIAAWNQPSYDINKNDQKGSYWEVRLSGVDAVAAVPEPGEWMLLLVGLGAVGAAARARRQTAA